MSGKTSSTPVLPRGQSHAHSLLEALANVLGGFAVSTAANYLILPSYGCSASLSSALEIGLIFTLISFARSYLFRRLFNLWHRKVQA
jgi:hypothetical protein